MRGRTNISSGGNGLAINGSIEQFQVAEENTIVAGDFVEYEFNNENNYLFSGYFNKSKYGGDYKPIIYSFLDDSFLVFYYLTGNYQIGYFKVENGEIALKATIAYSNKYWGMPLCVLENGLFVVVNRENLDNKIYLYKIEDDNFVQLDYVDSTIKSAFSVVDLKNGYFCVIGGSSTTSEFRSYLAEVYSYSETSLELLFTVSSFLTLPSSITLSSMTNISPRTFSVGENKFLLFCRYSSSYEIIYYQVDIDNNEINNISTNYFTYSTNAKYFGCKTFGDLLPINTETFLTSQFYMSGTNSLTPVDAGVFRIIYVQDDALAIVDNVEIVSDDDTGGGITCQPVKENVLFVAYLSKDNQVNIKRLEYNPSTHLISNVSNIVTLNTMCTADSDYIGLVSYGIFLESGNEIFYLYTDYTDSYEIYCVKLLYQNGVLEIGEQTNLVKPYSGGSAMGIAKDSGTAGDTIDVYVPSITT